MVVICCTLSCKSCVYDGDTEVECHVHAVVEVYEVWRSGRDCGEAQLVVRDPTTRAELRRAKYVDGWHASTQRP